MPLVNTIVVILTRLKPSFAGLKNKAAAIGTRSIDRVHAVSTSLSPVSRTKTAVRKLADRFPVLRSWQFWATTFTAASFLFAVLSFWTSLDASQYARWTAHKDFALLCMEKSTRYLSPQCPDAANISLPAPPGFHGTWDRRDEDDYLTDADWGYLHHDTCSFRASSQTTMFLPWVDYKLVCSAQESIFIEGSTNRFLTLGQCRTHTTFWATIQVAVAISALSYGGTFPSWPQRPTSARESLEASHQLLKTAALERSGWLWRTRSIQSILLVFFLSIHGLLCSDGGNFVSQRITTIFSGFSRAEFLLMEFLGQFLSPLLSPLFFIIFLCLQDILPSKIFSTDKGDQHTFINEIIYLSCAPFLSFVLTTPDLPGGTWWLPLLVCTALKPKKLENILHECYEEWIEDTRESLKICSDCERLEGYAHDYLGALKKCWKKGLSLQYREQAIEEHFYVDWIEDAPDNMESCFDGMRAAGLIHEHARGWKEFRDRDSFLQSLGCIICLRLKEEHSQKDKDRDEGGSREVETFVFGYGALLDRSIWDTFGCLLELLMPWVVLSYGLEG